MLISIVIPAFNEERLIVGTLRRIKDATVAFQKRGWMTEIIVCDNHSTDRTGELARAAGVIVVFEQVNQIARARNRGAETARGEWLMFVDADSHPSLELFEEVARQIESGKTLAGGCTVKLDEQHIFGNIVTGVWNLISRSGTWLAGSFIFCEAAAFREIGGFSNELFASEEIDLTRRLKMLARARRKRIIILHRHPIVTSARKLTLYSKRDYFLFMLKTILARGKTLRSAADCPIWYDGKR